MQAMKMGYEKSGEPLARVTELQGQAKAKEHFNKGACDQRHFPATTLPPTNALCQGSPHVSARVACLLLPIAPSIRPLRLFAASPNA